uniref:Uncharacterized protein n=1 Tax=Rhizophora mucronata TaxID=61149 RepID=A0A2P2IUG0_RHIMU
MSPRHQNLYLSLNYLNSRHPKIQSYCCH